MEPARSTEIFSRRITSTDANNIVAVLDLNQVNSEYQIFAEDYICKFQVALEDLKVTVNLPSLSPAPFPDINALMSEAAQQAEIAKLQTQGQKIALGLYTAKANGPWEYKSRVVLMNQGGDETHVPILVPFLSTNETLLVGGDFKLGVKIEPVWNQPLKASDYLVITGTYRQVVSFSKKKDDDLDALSDRISALENLLQLFGAATPATAGTNGLVKGAAAGQENYLLRGDRSWENPEKFIKANSSGLYGGAEIPSTAKNGWGGLFFEGGGNKNYLMQNPAGDIGLYNAAIPRWNFYATDAMALIGLPLQINGSALISKVLAMSTIISLPNIAPGGLHSVVVTFTGVATNHFVMAVPVVNPITNGFWTFYVHCQVLAANQVTIFVKNDWSGALDLPDFWLRLIYFEVSNI